MNFVTLFNDLSIISRTETTGMRLNNKNEQWLVLKTKHKAENKACEFTRKAGFTCFLPKYTSYHKWSDRIKKVQMPLIPNSLFVKCTPSKHTTLYTIPLVTSILKEFGEPAIVKEHEINNLIIISRELNGENIRETSILEFNKGEEVIVIRGQFKGLKGRFLRQQGNSRLIIEIKAMQTAFSINIPASQVKNQLRKKHKFRGKSENITYKFSMCKSNSMGFTTAELYQNPGE